MASQETAVDAATIGGGGGGGEDASSSSTHLVHVVTLNPSLPAGLTRTIQALRSLFWLMNDEDFEEEVEIELYRREQQDDDHNNNKQKFPPKKQWITVSEHERKMKQALQESSSAISASPPPSSNSGMHNVSGGTSLSATSSNGQVSSRTLGAGELDIIQNCAGSRSGPVAATPTPPTKKHPFEDYRNGENCDNSIKKKRDVQEMEQDSTNMLLVSHHDESLPTSSSQQENHGDGGASGGGATIIGKESSDGNTESLHIAKKKRCTMSSSARNNDNDTLDNNAGVVAPAPVDNINSKDDGDDDDAEDDDDDDSDTSTTGSPFKIGMKQPRGKHEAMAVALAATSAASVAENDDDDDDDDNHGATAVSAADNNTIDTSSTMTKSLVAHKKVSSTSKKASSKQTSKSSSKASSACSNPSHDSNHHDRSELLLHEPTQPITSAEYENLEALMIQFCRVPLLAEFSRPVALLHPDLAPSYAKIVKRPMDLGHVCRGVRRRSYKNTRDVRLDIWRVFANCVTFNSHENNMHATPSFVSIALHLLEYFNSLWQEHMLPSDMPSEHSPSSSSSTIYRNAYIKRNQDRTKRLESCSILIMSEKFMTKVSNLLAYFLENGGCIDALDQDEILSPQPAEIEPGVQNVISNLSCYRDDLIRMSTAMEEYNVNGLVSSLRSCCTHGSNGDPLLEDNPALRSRIANRLDRLIGQLLVPLYEANSRGVTQSSIWGNIYKTVWARSSGKRAYWPALCLGILAPENQRQDWHLSLMERNEARLPQKQGKQLASAKEKCERAQKRNDGVSYCLVEFLGSHEFGWVRDTDIVENFDAMDNPNEKAIKNKRGFSRSAIANVMNSKMYAMGMEECKWATNEFEQVLQEAFDFDEMEDDTGDNVGNGEFISYSYSLLNQSDDEADEEDNQHGYEYDLAQMTDSDVEDATWLIENDGSKKSVGSQGRKR